jgi:hypothetical protein
VNGPLRLTIRHLSTPWDESAAPAGFRPSPVGATTPGIPRAGTPDRVHACPVGCPLADANIRTAPVIPDQLEHDFMPAAVLAGRVDLTRAVTP